MGTKPLQKVASAGRAGAAGKADPCLWFQLYVLTDRPFVRKLVLGTPSNRSVVCLQVQGVGQGLIA